MESLESLRERIEALEHHTHLIERRLRWWRVLTCGAVVLSLYSVPLAPGTAHEEATAGASQGLAHRFGALEEKLRYIMSVTTAEGLPEVVISGANLRIVNGLGSTDCRDEQENPIPDCPNGLGNLIVGYNELRVGFPPSPNVRTGSHNVVVGQFHNFSSVGGLVAGRFNAISGEFASVSGGSSNRASGFAAAVSGGIGNTASGFAASVSGGREREASGENDWVAGPLFADF
jgi:hypothetical protein